MRKRADAFRKVALDEVRRYWNTRPCNVRHSARPQGSREYFEEVEARKYFVEPHIPLFADFDAWRGKRVLEIGCGIGTDTINFARHGARVTAVDLSEESLALARRRADVFGLGDRIRFHLANAERLSEVVPVETYDLIYSFGVIHHTPRPERALEELRRYAGPHTTLKVMVYHRWSWKVFQILVTYGRGRFWKIDRLVAEHSEAQTGCPVTYAYSRRGGTALLEGAGFRVRDARAEHIFPYRIPDYVRYRYVRQWYWRLLPDRLFRWLERRIGWHLCLTATVAHPRDARPRRAAG